MAEKTINIGGRLHSTATGNVVAAANEVFDYTKNKTQEEINADTYSKEETYNKNELNNLITTPDVQHITVPTFGSLPVSGSANTIYRVSNWDGGATPPAVDASKYSEYGWDGSRYVLLSVKSAVDEVFDVSVFNAESGVAKAYETLTAALGGVPANRKKGGMSIKFIQTTPATYNVVKTEGVTELPTGTLLDSASSVASGTYTASQLTDFATLPTASAVTYYVAVTEDETTTYTTWVITLAQSSDSKYVQYFLTNDEWSTSEADWEKLNLEDEISQLRYNLGIHFTNNITTGDNLRNFIALTHELIAGKRYHISIYKSKKGNTHASLATDNDGSHQTDTLGDLIYFAESTTEFDITPTVNAKFISLWNSATSYYSAEVTSSDSLSQVITANSQAITANSQAITANSQAITANSQAIGDWHGYTETPIENFVNGSLDTNEAYEFVKNRIIGTLDLTDKAGQKFYFSVKIGDYQYSIRMLSTDYIADPTEIAIETTDIIERVGWVESGVLDITNITKSAIIIIRHSNNAAISTADVENLDTSIGLGSISNVIEDILNETTPAQISGYYEGEPIDIGRRNPFLFSLWKTIGITSYAQSFAKYDDYIVFFYGNNAGGSLWRISTLSKLADLTFPRGNYSTPHGNVMCFGKEFAEGNSELPLLYVSQWDGDGGCLVYDLHLDGSILLVQTIIASNMDVDVFGSSLGDWVVDKNAGEIVSVKYHLPSSTTELGNSDHICRFKLPKLSDGAEIVLTNTDIIDSFVIPFTPISQDKKIYNGILFIAAGWTSTANSQKIFVCNIGRKSITSIINLSQWGGEPEGLEIIDNGIIIGYGYGNPVTNIYAITFPS